MAATKDQNCPCVFKAKPASKTVRVRTRNEEVEGGFTKRRLIIVTRQKDDNNTKDKRLKDCEKYLLKLKRRLTIKGAFVFFLLIRWRNLAASQQSGLWDCEGSCNEAVQVALKWSFRRHRSHLWSFRGTLQHAKMKTYFPFTVHYYIVVIWSLTCCHIDVDHYEFTACTMTQTNILLCLSWTTPGVLCALKP